MSARTLAPIPLAPIALDRIDEAEIVTVSAPTAGRYVTRVFGGLLDGQAHGSPDADSALRRHAGLVASCMRAAERRPGS